MRKQLFLLVMTAMMVFVPSTIFAQRHFYNRIELGAGNVWGFVGTGVISTIINQLAHKPLTESTLRITVPSTEYGNLNGYQGFCDWNYDCFTDNPEYWDNNTDYAKFSGRNLLSNVIIGDKAGYLSDHLGSLNYCVYGAAYYNTQNFKLMENEEDYTNLTIQRAQLGGGVMLILGSIEKSSRFILDGGIRYDIPLHFSSEVASGSVSDNLNSGISSHYMFKYSYENSIAVGATLDLLHYNMFKNENLCGDKSKLVEFGITVSFLFY